MTPPVEALTRDASQSLPKLSATGPKWPVRNLLLVLVLACLAPAVIGIGVMFAYMLKNGRAQLEKDTILTARALVQTFDAELVKAQVVADALATSNYIDRQDLAGLHQRAQQLIRMEAAGLNVVLSDKNAQMVLNTLRPFGQSLPRHGNPPQIRHVFETGQANISNVFVGAITGHPNMSVDVPVLSGGKVVYVLSVAIVPEQLFGILSRQQFPADWIASLSDSTGTLMTRSQSPEKYIGKKANPELLARLTAAQEGAFESITKEGMPALIIYSRSSSSNWTVAIAIPRQHLEAPLMRTVYLAAIGAAALFALGGSLAWFMGGRIARSVSALTAPAIALEAGEPVQMSEVYFREADEVTQSMARTARILEQRTTDRKRAEMELQNSDASRMSAALFTEQLLAQLPVGVAMRKANGDFIDANPAFLAILGRTREQLRGLTDAQVTPTEFAALDATQTHLLEATGSYGPYEKEYIRADASRLPVQVRGRYVEVNGKTALLSVAEDISARRKAAFLQAQSQKMDAIGQLTGGLAHDFNNMLGVIIGNLDLLEASVAGNVPAQTKVATALNAALRGADLTRALLSVARAQAVVSEPVDLNTRLNELLPLIRHTAGSSVEVIMTLSESPTVEVDPSGLSSTVLNLAINARDAMPSGGKLTISTRLRTVTEDGESLKLPPGQYAALSVTDTGTGMTPEVLAQALTPFFTTKERGRGTGLGLAVANGFVNQCGGELLLYSEPGYGTTVKLLLPTTAAMQHPAFIDKGGTDPDNMSLVQGTEKILVVEDEMQLLTVTSTWLSELGYKVTPCISPTSALTALKEAVAEGQPFALMVTDVIMPGMDGFALAIAARLIQPDLSLVYVSGFADAADRGRQRPDGEILEKPFRQPALATLVRSKLDTRQKVQI